MGLKNPDGSVCWIKDIRNALRKGEGDTLHVVIRDAQGERSR